MDLYKSMPNFQTLHLVSPVLDWELVSTVAICHFYRVLISERTTLCIGQGSTINADAIAGGFLFGSIQSKHI